MHTVLHGSGRGAGAPDALQDRDGMRLEGALSAGSHGLRARERAPRPETLSTPGWIGRSRQRLESGRGSPTVPRVRPRPRACLSRLHAHRAAAVWRRTVGVDSTVSRPQKPRGSRGQRRLDGDRASIRGWRSHVQSALADGNHVGTRRQRPTTPGRIQRKTRKNPLRGAVWLLTIGVLIRVRPQLGQTTDFWLPVLRLARC